MLTFILIVFVAAPILFVNIVVASLLALRGTYVSRSNAVIHTSIAFIVPVLTTVIFIIELGNQFMKHPGGLLNLLILLLGLYGLALFPMFIHAANRPIQRTSENG